MICFRVKVLVAIKANAYAMKPIRIEMNKAIFALCKVKRL